MKLLALVVKLLFLAGRYVGQFPILVSASFSYSQSFSLAELLLGSIQLFYFSKRFRQISFPRLSSYMDNETKC